MNTINKRFNIHDYFVLIIILIGTYMMTQSVLLFHTFLELFTIVIGLSLGIISLTSFKKSEFTSILYLGMAYFFIGILDLFHIFAYPGMPLLAKASIQLGSQFWVVARLIEAVSLFIAVRNNLSRSNVKRLIAGISIISSTSIFIILKTDYFPSTFIDGFGLTNFKIYFEYIIILIFIISLFSLLKHKENFKGFIYDYMIIAIVSSIISEFLFTRYGDVQGVIISLGHGFKMISYYMVFKGVIVGVINHPYDQIDMERDKFLMMFNKSSEAIILLKQVEDKIVVTKANEKVCSILGLKLDDIIGREFGSLFIDNEGKNQLLSSITKFKMFEIFEVQLESVNGSKLIVDLSSTIIEIFNEKILLLNIIDISKRKEYQRDSFIYKSIVENTQEPIILTDNHQKIIWVNNSFENLYGYKLMEIKGKTPSILSSGEHDSVYYKSMFDALNKYNHWVGNTVNKKKDGSLVQVYQSISNIRVEESNQSYYFSVMVDQTEKIESEMKIFNLAYVDNMTGLYNMHYIEDVIYNASPPKILIAELRYLRQATLIMNRGILNSLIKEFVEVLSEICDDDMLFLLDYNKVLIILSDNNKCKFNNGENFIEKIIDTIRLFENSTNYSSKVIANLAGVTNEGDKLDILEMIKKGRLVLHYLERSNIGLYSEYNSSLEEMLIVEENLIIELKEAIDNQEIEVNYQPIVNQFTGKVIGAEALARWNHFKYGYIEPMKFIKIAEINDMIAELGYLVMLKACSSFKQSINLDKDVLLSVNVSIMQLQDPMFITHVEEVLDITGFPSSNLILEVTESSAIENYERVLYVMEKLSSLKVKFALDDFGTGFSSISMLKQLPISYIKIDKIFIDDINSNIQNSLLVSAIISLSHKLGLTVIVEGIETVLQANVIRNNNCKMIQGFYYSKPVEYTKFEEILLKGFKTIEYELAFDQLNEIEAEKEHFKSIRNHKNFGTITMNLFGNIIEANQEAESIFGYLRYELEDKSSYDLLLDESKETFKNCMSNIINNADVCDEFYRGVRKSGSIVDLSITSYVEYDWEHKPQRIVSIVEDITETIDKNLKMIKLREAYRKVFDESPIAIILWDSDYNINGWNKSAQHTFGWEKLEVLGKKISILIGSEEFYDWKLHSERLLSGISESKLGTNITKYGQNVICEWINKPIFDDLGKVDFVLSIVTDLTSIKRQEQEVSNMKEIIVRQDRMAEIGQLVAGIAHEINNPLSYMISNSEMLEEDISMYSSNLEKVKGYLNQRKVLEHEEKVKLYEEIKYWEDELKDISESFKDGLGRIKEIVLGLKTFSWSGKDLSFERYNINDNINQVLIIARNELKYSTNLRLNLDEHTPTIDAISNQVNQVILNMLLNSKYAIESKEENTLGEIKLTTWYDELYVYLSVEDNGLGIDEKILETIFEPFFTTKPKNIGTGLGLSISKTIIEENHKGMLWVESKLGIGTKFTISLPIKQSHILS